MKKQQIILLDQRAKRIAASYINTEKQLLEIIMEVEKYKVHYHLGFNSLFAYITESLKLSPAQSYSFIKVARKSREVPALKKAVVNGELSISKAQKMTSVINQDNHKQWLSVAKEKTHRQLEKEVALASPKHAVAETIKYVNCEMEVKEKVTVKQAVARMELKLGISEKLMLKLRRAQDLLSGFKKSHQSLEQTLDEILDIYLAKKDPIQKAKRQAARGQLINKSENKKSEENNSSREELVRANGNSAVKMKDSGVKANRNRRKPIPASIRYQVYLRDEGACTHSDINGRLCRETRYLEVHHIKQVAHGGGDDVSNLRLLCSGHHKVAHLK